MIADDKFGGVVDDVGRSSGAKSAEMAHCRRVGFVGLAAPLSVMPDGDIAMPDDAGAGVVAATERDGGDQRLSGARGSRSRGVHASVASASINAGRFPAVSLTVRRRAPNGLTALEAIMAFERERQRPLTRAAVRRLGGSEPGTDGSGDGGRSASPVLRDAEPVGSLMVLEALPMSRLRRLESLIRRMVKQVPVPRRLLPRRSIRGGASVVTRAVRQAAFVGRVGRFAFVKPVVSFRLAVVVRSPRRRASRMWRRLMLTRLLWLPTKVATVVTVAWRWSTRVLLVLRKARVRRL